MGDIGNKLGTDIGTITPVLKRFEAAGRIFRTRDHVDGRRVLITFTDDGLVLQSELWRATERIKSACQLSDEKLEELRDTLFRKSVRK
ncbi:MarR family winged helix-turn-helix transcriptional regulator [Rahnella ecdela]|uniref:MarR family winged helix-turn-helix transcriptional regulator n=1 Tax=Rahnella ecdela TaxID=2816250 RepID=UPI0030843D4C